MIASILLALFLAGSNALHEEVHHDADAADHQCVITLFSKGLIDAAVAMPILAVLVSFLRGTVAPLQQVLIPATDYQLLPGRAPPLRFS